MSLNPLAVTDVEPWISAISNNGFPAACVLALFWFIRTELREFRKTLDRLTRASLLQTIARGGDVEQKEAREILSEFDTKQGEQ